jgi:hypothetical protein
MSSSTGRPRQEEPAEFRQLVAALRGWERRPRPTNPPVVRSRTLARWDPSRGRARVQTRRAYQALVRKR